VFFGLCGNGPTLLQWQPRQFEGFMIEEAKQWEGQLLGGRYRLGRLLGGSDQSAVFLVEQGASAQAPAVIRFLQAMAGAAEQLKQWESLAKLSHPNLIRIFEAGRCQFADRSLLYVVSECADESLAQILPERALTAKEARQVLEAVLAALAHIHEQGLVHSGLRPSNIFAVGKTVKISSDSIRPVGQPLAGQAANPPYDAPECLSGKLAPPADIWSLGVTLTEVFTQRVPEFDSQLRIQPAFLLEIPQPFQDIIENCLQTNPARRWGLAQIAACLREQKPDAVSPGTHEPVLQKKPAGSSTAGVKKESSKWPYALAIVAAILVAIVLHTRSQSSAPKPVEKPSTSETSAAPSTSGANRPGQVTDRVMPQVSAGALHTIQGRIRVQVEVHVDEKGGVAEARLKSAGPSQYFARKALEAAKGWKFRPPVEEGQPVASRWLVHFTFRPRAVDESAEQIKP
jgi:TonB family protein